MVLTDAGRALYDRSRHLLTGLGAALDQAREAGGAQSGSLRITLPFRAWELIVAPKLAAFQANNPGIVLDLEVEEGLTDIVARGFHAGIRLGDHLQDDMIAVRLSGPEEAAYVAAPAYLARHGVPAVPDDLLGHTCIRHRQIGQYWLVGDARNAPGRSLYVRLAGSAASRGRAGKWTDAATGEHGDLFDIIRESCGLTTVSYAADEARRFLSLPRPPLIAETRRSMSSARIGSPESARRLFAMSQPIKGTIVETYLRSRGISQVSALSSLRFHPRCYSRSEPQCPTEARPAMIAAVTDLNGMITGVQRTWLDPSGTEKARMAEPRRAMGGLLGHAVRFGQAHDVLGVGEGIETTLSIRDALPGLPLAAALSAAHLASILFPPTLRRLYILRDNDPAGVAVVRKLTDRAQSVGIEVIELVPQLGDFNDELRAFGTEALRANLRSQIAPADVARLMKLGTEPAGKE